MQQAGTCIMPKRGIFARVLKGGEVTNLAAGQDSDWIITTGGTGLSPRDVTPEATVQYCDRLVPGIAEILRMESCRQTPNAMGSRSIADMKGKTIAVNLPGSAKAATFCATILIPVIKHAGAMIEGQGH
jgi:molybdenum cofactor synthesis domain-containing protein